MNTREQAREYFKERGLSYSDIDIRALRYLQVELNEEFNRCQKAAMNGEMRGYWVRVNDAKRFKGEYGADGKMVCAYLTGKGTYFTAREIVSFNKDGFIGFCGAADDVNTQPVINAFMRWCDWLNRKPEGGNIT